MNRKREQIKCQTNSIQFQILDILNIKLSRIDSIENMYVYVRSDG